MMLRSAILFSVLLQASAQFKCTFSGAKDASTCTTAMDGNKNHCVWCAVSVDDAKDGSLDAGAGFCVAETQAEAMEDSIPKLHCDRYNNSDDDDDSDADDDTAGEDDDFDVDDDTKADDDEGSDDDSNGNDDELPDNYWKCLQVKTSTKCASAGCTWCDTKGGFGMCLTGPSADSAADSDWFTCKKKTEEIKDVLDGSCVKSYLEDPTVEGCTGTTDASGKPCEWCTLFDVATLCLSEDQATTGRSLGVSCQESDKAVEEDAEDPYDPSCVLAYLQDSSKAGCLGAQDMEGNACEYCSLQGALDVCLTEEQAEMGQQLGITCDEDKPDSLDDPYDPSCVLAFLQDSSKEGCLSAQDMEGNACEYCSLQGALDVCLTEEQAEMGEQIGISCDGAETKQMEDPYDPSCVLAFFQDSSKEGCLAAKDADGNACEFCTLQGALDVCLTEEQAEMGEQLGITCDASSKLTAQE